MSVIKCGSYNDIIGKQFMKCERGHYICNDCIRDDNTFECLICDEEEGFKFYEYQCNCGECVNLDTSDYKNDLYMCIERLKNDIKNYKTQKQNVLHLSEPNIIGRYYDEQVTPYYTCGKPLKLAHGDYKICIYDHYVCYECLDFLDDNLKKIYYKCKCGKIINLEESGYFTHLQKKITRLEKELYLLINEYNQSNRNMCRCDEILSHRHI